MKKLLAILLLACGIAHADETTPNLITNSWNNVNVGTHPNDCCTGGSRPLYDPATNTIHFSYGLTAVHQVHAINQALSGSGIQINGWNWGYTLRNMDGVAGNQNRTTDTLSATSFITNSSGQIVQQSDQYYNTQFDWTRFEGTETLNSPIALTNGVNLGIQFVSKDNGFWAGYYGPQVKDVSLSANYGVDACAANPLSDPNCPGYATAYLNLQCTANPLYSPSCPGYTAAQCNINPLYSSSCPGYQAAYYAQQCSLNPLYDVNCPGYAAAYLDYQCSLDPLYSTTCAGYETAYFNQQCSLDALYSNQCPGYAEAYAKKNILNIGNTTTTTPVIETVTVTEPSTVSTGDTAVDKVINTTTTSTTSPTATVQLVPTTSSTTTSVTATTTEAKTDDNTQSSTTEESTQQASSSETSKSDGGSSSGGKSETQSPRQKLAERKREAAKRAAVAAGKEAAESMSTATSMESQVAVQNVVIAAMGYTPGFDVYNNLILADAMGYKPFEIYKNQNNVDNRRLSRGLTGASDRVHEQMVSAQWEK